MLTTNPNDPQLKEGQKNETGQHEIYLVLSEEERAKGYVRPLRDTYVHVGKKIERDDETGGILGALIKSTDPEYDTRNGLYTEENGYGGYIKYPKSMSPLVGKYITKEELDAIIARKSHFGGCGTSTKMGHAIAETYSTNPKFYGATFCYACNKHLPVDQFVWEGTDEIVGS